MPDQKQEKPHDHSNGAHSCPKCGKPMKKAMFRTGSVSTPGHNVQACTNCNRHQADNNPS